MLFHAFRVVYTVKELDSHAKHGQSLKKKMWTYNRVFLCQKSHFWVRTSFGEFFSIVVLFFCYQQFLFFIFSQTTQHNIQNKTKQNSRHILNISRFNQKGGREGRTTRTQKLLL